MTIRKILSVPNAVGETAINDPFHLTQDEAISIGRDSKPCDPKAVVYAVRCRVGGKPPRRKLTRPQAIEWLLQNGIEALLGDGAALLALRVTSYVSPRKTTGTLRAWIGRGTLAEIAGKHRKTVDSRRALSPPRCTTTTAGSRLFSASSFSRQAAAKRKRQAAARGNNRRPRERR